jgi:hypothetical protein
MRTKPYLPSRVLRILGLSTESSEVASADSIEGGVEGHTRALHHDVNEPLIIDRHSSMGELPPSFGRQGLCPGPCGALGLGCVFSSALASVATPLRRCSFESAGAGQSTCCRFGDSV